MQKEILKEYSDVSAQIKKLTETKKELSEKIIVDMHKEELLNHDTLWGKFYLRSSPVYEYSTKVQKMEGDIKAIKKLEVDEGIAILKSKKTSLSMR